MADHQEETARYRGRRKSGAFRPTNRDGGGKPPPSPTLFDVEEDDHGADDETVCVELRGIRLERVRTFGDAWLALGLTVHLGTEPNLAVVADLPWGSIATVQSAGDKLYRIVGPAIWQTDKWVLPVFPADADELAGYSCAGGFEGSDELSDA